jgi:cytidylate kinase
MSVITISRGTFSGGKALAECLSHKLGYQCIDRDDIVQRAVGRGISEQELHTALEQPPTSLATFNHKKYIYLALIQAALAEAVRTGKAIYHGHGGHLLLQGGIKIMRLRIIAPLEYRIRMAQQRLGLSRNEVIAYIQRMDQERRKWTQYLYGVDWESAALYDLVINLEYLNIEQACHIVTGMVQEAAFEFTPDAQAIMNDFALASRVRAELAINPLTSNLEVTIEARNGVTTIKGHFFEQGEEIQKVAHAVAGVTDLRLQESAPADLP